MKIETHHLYTDITGNQISIKSYEFGKGTPMLYLQGGIHGGEVTYFIFQQIFEYLKSIENLLKFKVLLVPIVNPISWQQRVYYYPIGKFSLQNGQDFNRHYSEKEYEGNGIPQKISTILYKLSKEYKIALDFHTARHSKPYLYVEDASLISLANLIGLELNLLDFELNTTEFSGFYVNKMRKDPHATKAFTVECGSHDEYNTDNIAEVSAGITRLLDMLMEFEGDLSTQKFENPKIKYCKPKRWEYALATGFARFYKQPREAFKKGDLLAEIYDASDLNTLHQIFAQEDGIIIQHTKTQIYLEGDELLWYGVLTPELYLAQEAQADHKSEYHAGEVAAMAGAQEPHNRIVSNLLVELGICLKVKKRKCQVYPSDFLLKLPECEKYVYADITIVCDKIELDPEKHKGLDVLLNPQIVVEVLSESTASYDKIEKMRCYLMLASLKQYVLVDSTKVDVITYTRTPENDWLMHTETDPNASVEIGDCLIALEDIYRKNL